MSLWFEILVVCILVVFYIEFRVINKRQKQTLDYTEAHYNTTKTFTRWIVTSGMIDMIKSGVEGIRQFREMRKNDKKDTM